MSAASEDSTALVRLESSIVTLNDVEQRLAADLDLYRRVMMPLVHNAAYRISGEAQPSGHIIRQFFHDSFVVQDSLRMAVRHAGFACDMAKELKRHIQ